MASRIWDEKTWINMNYFLKYSGRCWLILVLFIAVVYGQFPLKCAENITSQDGTCCPISSGYNEVCGGPRRGRCTYLKDYETEPNILANLTKDDRLNWPRNFFRYACQCMGNFDGYDCSKCAFGFSGQECNKKMRYIRKDALELTESERKLLRDVLNIAKTKQSAWGVLNLMGGIDPVTNVTLQNLIPVSIYDLFVYIHVYAARFTQRTNKTSCYIYEPHIDSAHMGSAFLTWHRLHLLQLERELRVIANSEFGVEDFSLPYWDWVDDGRSCEVCTNDLFGKVNETAVPGRIESHSPFSEWKALCPLMPECTYCNPAAENGYIYRRFGKKTTSNLPTRREVDFAMSRPLYDSPPFNYNADERSFRAVIEGFANNSRFSIKEDKLVYSKVPVHQMGGGIFSDLLSTPGDPLFIGHHVFIDKLFEMWLRKMKPTIHEFPAEGAPIGHNRDTPIVPFFPPFYTNAMFFVDSRNLGYDFDYMMLQSDKKAPLEHWVEWIVNHPYITGIIVIVGYVLLLLVIVANVIALICKVYRCQNKKIFSISGRNIKEFRKTSSTDEWDEDESKLLTGKSTQKNEAPYGYNTLSQSTGENKKRNKRQQATEERSRSSSRGSNIISKRSDLVRSPSLEITNMEEADEHVTTPPVPPRRKSTPSFPKKNDTNSKEYTPVAPSRRKSSVQSKPPELGTKPKISDTSEDRRSTENILCEKTLSATNKGRKEDETFSTVLKDTNSPWIGGGVPRKYSKTTNIEEYV